MLVVNHTELPWSHSVNLLISNQMPCSIRQFLNHTREIFWCVANLESDTMGCSFISFPRVLCDEMEVCHIEVILIDTLWVVAMRNKKDISLQVLLHYKPRTSAESQSFTLSNCIEPKSLVSTDFFASFYLSYIAWILSQVLLDVFAKIDISQETNALRILSACIEEIGFFSQLTHFMLPKMSYRKHELRHLQGINLA